LKSTQNCGKVLFGINSQVDAGVAVAEAVVAEEEAAADAVEAVGVNSFHFWAIDLDACRK
jgi:hypothetical protein